MALESVLPLEVCMLPTEGIWEDMKKGHEFMKNPVLRQMCVGSWSSLWLKGNSWVFKCFGHRLPLHSGGPSPPPTAHLAGVGQEDDVQSDKSPDLLLHEFSLRSRLIGSWRPGGGIFPMPSCAKAPVFTGHFPKCLYLSYTGTLAVPESAGKGYLSFILCVWVFSFFFKVLVFVLFLPSEGGEILSHGEMKLDMVQ